MDLKNKTNQDLIKMVKEKKESLKDFRFGIAGSKVRNVKEGKALRRETARILTELNKRNK